MSEWWKGKALGWSAHKAINARHYPGTRQLCARCDDPTGRCEEDSLYVLDVGPLCEECHDNLVCEECREAPATTNLLCGTCAALAAAERQ